MKFILGTKEKMTEYFSENGTVVPVTIVSAGPVTVTQVKTKERDGYSAVQVGFGEKKKLNKAQTGHLKDLGRFRYLKEFHTEGEPEFKVGDMIRITDAFKEGDTIRVSSTSKGKGFQGVVKRHGFKGGPRTHGQKHSEREPGSIGGGLRTHVPKGMKMAGRMGGDRITQKNLKVVAVDGESNTLLIKGAVSGTKGTLVEIVTQ